MKTLTDLCQRLLNGPVQAGDLHYAEHLLSRELGAIAAAPDKALPALGQPWHCPLLTDTEGHSVATAGRLLALAPLYLLDGAWLARVAQPANGHEAVPALLSRLYLDTAGLDDPTQSPPLRFRARLVREGIQLPPLHSPDFFTRAHFPAALLHFCGLHLAFLHRPRRFLPELLGYTLAHVCRAAEPGEDWEMPDWRPRQADRAREAVAVGSRQGLCGERLGRGWALYIRHCRAVRDDLTAWAGDLELTREARLVGIIQAKLPHALGYHTRVRLQGKSLDDWLQEQADDPVPLLRALHDSPRVRAECPAASRLLRAMDFGGPMFGVFSATERQAFLDWIESPDAPADHRVASLPGDEASATGLEWPDDNPPPPAKAARPPQSRRELYLALLQAESPADAPPEGEAFIRHVLRRVRWLHPWRLGAPPFDYSAESLRRFTETRHRAEIDRYRPLQGAPRVDRAFCLWAIQQLAPAILNDGAWLADIAGPAEHLDEVRRYLLRIYVDELGAGHPEWNHPNVYRRLLDEQGITLPAFDSEAFAHHPALLDAAFDIPVYLLAMGLFGAHYRPEQLGL
ncbi:MAG: iron-containing redox enzyme family protein, partial [Methylococcus sp.]